MLKYTFFSVIFITVFFSSCNHQTKKTKLISTKDTTSITVNKLFHDFGNVNDGETLGCFFVITNSGDKPLLIHDLDLGCGCISASYSKEPVLPGDSTDVEVRFNTSGFYGKQYKVIQLLANIKESKKELVITANVIN